MRNLDPNSFDISLILEGRLKNCPLCADFLVAILNRVNDETTIYRSIISCSKCGCQVGYNDRDLDKAKEGAIDRWNTRAYR